VPRRLSRDRIPLRVWATTSWPDANSRYRCTLTVRRTDCRNDNPETTIWRESGASGGPLRSTSSPPACSARPHLFCRCGILPVWVSCCRLWRAPPLRISPG
jgi:hypothetical protein